MKKLIYHIIFLGISISAVGQEQLSRTQFYVNPEWTHPATAGINDYLDISVMYRQGLNVFDESSSFYTASIFYQLTKSKNLESNKQGFRISNPDLVDELNKNSEARRKQGVGLKLQSIGLGPMDNQEIRAYYAYHLPISNSLDLSFGTSVAANQTSINYNQFTVRDEINDAFYQQLKNAGTGQQTNLLIDLGVALYSNSMIFTLSANSMVSSILSENTPLDQIGTGLQMSSLLGYKWNISSDFSVLPNAEIIFNPDYPFQYKTSVRVNYRKIVYAGASLHNELKWSMLCGFKIPGGLMLNYSYDYYNGYLKDFSNGVHEVTLNILLKNRYGSLPFTW
jgi:type IX secretion system PorP/SprF family membrane protein